MCFYLTLVTLASLSGWAKSDFDFVSTGGVFTVLETDRTLILPCGITIDLNTVQVQWTLDGHLIHNDYRRTQVGPNLHFARLVRTLDSGEFRCIVTELESGFGRTSPPIRINVVWISPSVTVHLVQPHRQEGPKVKPGQDVILDCTVEGSLEIKFRWNKNGNYLKDSSRKLHLPRVQSESSGSYRCEVSNDAGNASSNFFHLLITDEHEFPEAPEIFFPESQILPVSSAVQLNCNFGEEDTTMEWIFEDILLQNSSRWSLSPNGTLLLEALSELETGLYKCRSNRHSLKFAATVEIATLDPLTFESLLPTPLPLTKTQLGFGSGSRAEVYCAVPQGNPVPRIWWERADGQGLSVRDGDTLLFSKISPADTGQYVCRAENIAGSNAFSVQVVITKTPRLTAQPQSDEVDEGDTVTLQCPYTGSPYPTTRVTWTHNGAPLKLHHKRIVSYEANGTLVIQQIKFDHHGAYGCHLTTQGHPTVISKEALVRVIQQLKFVARPLDRRLEIGYAYKIQCKAQGDPEPIVSWIKLGSPAFDWPPHIRLENGVLQFERVEKSDEGKYMCMATNSIQGMINATIQVNVFASPRFVLTPKNPTEGIEGEPLQMDCSADGDPRPTIKWDLDRDAEAINTSDRFILFENGSLYIRELSLDDHGRRFGCTAGNSGGFKREEVELVVARNDDYMSPEQSGVMTRTVWITLSVAASYMLLVIGLMLWCRYRQLRRKATYLADIRAELVETELKDSLLEAGGAESTTKPQPRAESVRSEGETHSSILGSAVQPKSGGGSGTASLANSQRSHGSSQSKRSYEEISGERKDLQFVMLLGHGSYGEVFLAKTGDDKVVMVKALQLKESSTLVEFRREIDLFGKVRHDNVAAVVRLCREMDPHYLIMEYSDWGDLKQFLLATRPDHPRTPKPPPVTAAQLVKIVSEVAIGMDQIANMRFVHKDLAARNCLISTGFRVQVSNSCLSKDTYAQEYSLFRNKLVPLRWLSPEALLEDDYSTKSDVWAFGCLLWEVSHQAALPWQPLLDTEVIAQWERKEEAKWDTKGLQPQVAQLLKECTSSCPRKRPTFTQVVDSLKKVKGQS